MSILQTKSSREQRPARDWIAESLLVAGILAFGYFALMLETTRQPWSAGPEQTSDRPFELLR